MEQLLDQFLSGVLSEWKAFILQEAKQTYFQELLAKLKNVEQELTPKASQVFRPFSFFAPNNTKLIIYGQDPYPNPQHACGLSFASNAPKLPQSLKRMILRLQQEYPELAGQNHWTKQLLEGWAQQGILLLNGVFTTNAFQTNAHRNWGWEQFNCHLLDFLLSQKLYVLLVFLGKQTENFVLKKIGGASQFASLSYPHPSPLTGRKFFDHPDALFKQINQWLKHHNHTPIDWTNGQVQ